jgi:hypothetical protein
MITVNQWQGLVGIGMYSSDPYNEAELHVNGDITCGTETVQKDVVVGEVEKLSIVRGTVDDDGTILDGDGFTVLKDYSGLLFTITFDQPFNAPPTVTATASNLGVIMAVGGATTTQCQISRVKIRNSTFVNPLTNEVIIIDDPTGSFNFIAISERLP